MNETYVTIVGNVVEKPVRRVTKAGAPFVTFRLASTVRRPDGDGGYVDAGTSFVNVCAFRRLALNVDASLDRGHPVLVHGRLRVRQWASGESSGTSVDVDATHIGHDLTRGQTRFDRGARGYDDGVPTSSGEPITPHETPAQDGDDAAQATPGGADDVAEPAPAGVGSSGFGPVQSGR